MTTFKSPAKLAAGLLIASVALVGCSNDDPETTTDTPAPETTQPAETPGTETPGSEPSTPAESPSAPGTPGTDTSPAPSGSASQGPVSGGDTFTGTGYTLVIPEGWASNEELSSGGMMELMLTKESGPTTDSINIITTPAGGQDIDTLLPQAKKELEAQVSEINDAPEKTVDGQPAKGFTGTLTQGDLAFSQYYIINGEQAYVITFGGPEGSTAVDDLFAGWKFSG